MRRFFLIGIILLLFIFPACGKKGDPLPPIVLVPKPVEQLDLSQQGMTLILEWRLPTVYTDGSPLPGISALELWMLSEEKDPESELPFLSEDRFREQGDIILEIPSEKFLEYMPDPEALPLKLRYEHPLNPEDLRKKRITFALVVKVSWRKYSRPSQMRSIDPLAVSLPPGDLKAEVFKDRIEITWAAPTKNMDDSEPAAVKGYNLYRADTQGAFLRINPALVVEGKFADTNFSLGKLYRYMIRSSANELPPYIESADSSVLEVLAEDIFPLSPPKGLVGVAGVDFVSLSWDLSREQDLDSYRVWRRLEGEEEFRCLTPDGISENAYTDQSVESDKRYEYVVTAVDQTGNESKQSKPVSIYVRGEG